MAETMVLLKKVDGVICPTPSVFNFGLQDVSAPDSGRVLDGNDTMYKNRTSQKRKIELQWNTLRPAEVTTILNMFNPEYINVTYWDALDGQEETREFYCGDKSAPVKLWTVGNKIFTSVSFNIIER